MKLDFETMIQGKEYSVTGSYLPPVPSNCRDDPDDGSELDITVKLGKRVIQDEFIIEKIRDEVMDRCDAKEVRFWHNGEYA